MSIFSRLADIVGSNITVLLDRAEDPEKMIRLMIQEMEDTLVEVRATAASGIADRKDIERRLDRIVKAQLDWDSKAELALSKGREDLAKGALLEKGKLADSETHMREELERLDQSFAKHEADITKLDAKLREVKAKQKAIIARSQTLSSQIKVRERVYDSRIDDAFVRFEQMERRLDATEGSVESMDLGRGKSLSEEIQDLEAESAIEEELAALKARVADRKSAKTS
jgi:phage shock protein A